MKDTTGMSKKIAQTDSPFTALQNEAARKRWELFHLAIAHAKKSNAMAMQDADAPAAEPGAGAPLLSIAR
ncbi:MAG: hypothetical protein ACE5FV_02560 [Woeseia sp.]